MADVGTLAKYIDSLNRVSYDLWRYSYIVYKQSTDHCIHIYNIGGDEAGLRARDYRL